MIKELQEIGKIVTGKTPSTKTEGIFDSQIPFVTPSDMNGRKIIANTERYLSKKGLELVFTSKIPKNSVMVSCIGSDMGKVAIAGRDCVTNQQINSIIVEPEVDYRFIYYSLSVRKAEFQRLAGGGSAQPILNKGHFSKLKIKVPSLSEQKAIAGVLGALDDKIELNRKMNETLEEMAQAIFKSWFVDFYPVKAKAQGKKPFGMDPKTAAFFPGSFEDSHLGKIPKGWKVGKVSDFANVEKGLSYKGKYLDLSSKPMINLGNFSPGGIFNHSKLKRYSGEYKERNIVGPGDIVIANTDITQAREVLGSPALVPDDEGEYLFTHHVFALRLKYPELNLFSFYALLQREFRSRAMGFATGTTVLALPKDAITNYELVQPSKEIISTFNEQINFLLTLKSLNIKQSQILSDSRDLLLPKLLSGEIRVN